MKLTPKQIAEYEERGFVAVEGVIPADRVAEMRQRIEELCDEWQSDGAKRVGAQQEADVAGAATGERSALTIRKFSDLVPHEPLFERHATDPAVLDLVESLIGAPIRLYADQALLKPPRIGSEKQPHQDNAYFRVDPADAVITAWCALDDATVENGCMHYLAESHKLGAESHTSIPGTPHLVPDKFAREQTIAVPLRAGGIVLHHSLTLHYTPTNTTSSWRRAFVCHYVREGAETPGRQLDSLRLVRF